MTSMRIFSPQQLICKTLVVFAISRKHGGICMAAKEVVIDWSNKKIVQVGAWVRPVSSMRSGCLKTQDLRMTNRNEVQLFDVINCWFVQSAFTESQPENWLMASRPIEHLGHIDAEDLAKYEDHPTSIWFEEGYTDRVRAENVSEHTFDGSLMMIRPEQLTLTLSSFVDPYGHNKSKIVARFRYRDIVYTNLSVTDLNVEQTLRAQIPAAGTPPVQVRLPKGDDYHLCLSLGTCFEHTMCHHKLVAGIY